MGAYENQAVIAEDYIYLNPTRADFISNHSVTDTAFLKINYINNAHVDSLSFLAPPFSCFFNNDSTILRFEIFSPVVGCFIDTLTIYASTGNFHVPLSAWVGTVGKGAVSGIWDTTIVKVKGDIFIANGQTLQVFPGTKVEFLGHYKIDVQGRILALGDSAEPVIFTPAQHETGWKGIRFINTSPANDSSIVSYCTLEYALNHGPSELNGGAVYVTNFSKLRISNCLVRNNHAQSGGGIMIADGSNIDVRNCIIKNNGGDGGGLYISYNSNPMIIGNQIIGNEGNDGGGININYGSNPLISNNLIMNNLGAWGGGFRIWAMSDPLIYNNTIINNSAVDAGGFRIENSSHPKISNNIIYGNKVYHDNSVVIDSTQIYVGTSADPDFFNNNIQGGLAEIVVEGGYSLNGAYTDNIDADPRFFKVDSHDYYLASSSPCVNAGKQDIGIGDLGTSVDLAGNPRIAGGRIDIGAFEYQCLSQTIPTVHTLSVSLTGLTGAIACSDVLDDGCSAVTERGVCWSTSQNPTIANNHTSNGIGSGVFMSDLFDLIQNTVYFVRAYTTNNTGTAYGDELIYIHNICGTAFTVNHLTARGVAPVNKTVTYGTVTNIPGAPSKCWITSNLGADHTADTVNDYTEASGGWYWQFNRKQGYKFDNSIRTPNTPWIIQIRENLDWLQSEDPCAIELGSGWRIPSLTEWTNVETSGNWTDWTGPWISDLKLHAAGFIENPSGLMYTRGLSGNYWSGTQGTVTGSRPLIFQNVFCEISILYPKSYGFSLRCLRDATIQLPAGINVTGEVSDQSCYNALQTITVAGSGTTFTVQNGGNAILIAGHNIKFLPTTITQSGGYLHGYIAPSGPWCQTPSMPAVEMQVSEIPNEIQKSTLKVYPNPTTGNFILELPFDFLESTVTVDIYAMWGEKILTKEFKGQRNQEFSLSDKPFGVYCIRIVSGKRVETVKIIKK